MRNVIALAVLTTLLSACAAMDEKVAASRQDRCERADWAQVGERDGLAGTPLLADRYEYICGELFKPGPYNEGFQKGRARKPRPAG
jgi:hypothetical protein